MIKRLMLEVMLPDLGATERLGRILGEIAEPGDVITLSGDLGAGKTTLAQSIGKGLLAPPELPITSPTFSLLHEYEARIPLYHMDLYRLSGEEELDLLGFEEYIHGEGLSVIEWPDRLGSLMPETRLEIELLLRHGSARAAKITPFGSHWEEKLACIANICLQVKD